MTWTVLPAAPAPAQSIAMVAQPPPPVPKPADPGGEGEDFGKSSPLGFLVLILFLIAVVFLARSMTKHLKRVPASFDEQAADGGEVSADSEQRPDDGDSGERQTKDAPDGAANGAGTAETGKAD